MEIFSKKRTVVAIALSMLLGACGSGESDQPSENLNENEVYIETDSGKEVITEKAEGVITTDGAPNAFAKMSSLNGNYEDLGASAQTCSDNSSYFFESDNVMVFGNASTTEDDYKIAAGWVESQFEGVSGVLEMSRSDYFNKRRNIAKFAIDNYVDNYANLPSVKDSLPDRFSEMPTHEKQALAWQNYIESDKEQRVELVLEASNYAGYGWTATDVLHEDKVKVCLHEQTGGKYVDAFYTGIAIPSPSLSIPDEHLSLIRTGLIQMAQESLSHSVYGNPLPVWFFKGQSLYYGGFGYAERSEHENVDVPMFVDSDDEYGYDQELLNIHYTMAYRYLVNAMDLSDRKSLFSILSVIAKDPAVYTQQDLPEDYDFKTGETGSLESSAFIKAWDDQPIIDEEYNDLNYTRFKHDYHELLSN